VENIPKQHGERMHFNVVPAQKRVPLNVTELENAFKRDRVLVLDREEGTRGGLQRRERMVGLT